MLNSLKQPHPLPDKKGIVVAAVAFGIVIALFLILLQPFGLEQVPDGRRKTMILMGYGIITFAVMTVNGALLPLLAPNIYNKERWTLGKDLFYLGVMNFGGIAIVNFLYSARYFHFELSWNRFLFSLFATLSVGFLPFVILVLLRHNRLLKSNLQAAAEMNTAIAVHHSEPIVVPEREQPDTSRAITLASESSYERVTFTVNDLLYAESADNYIKIVFMEIGAAKTALLRQTLKGMEDSLGEYEQVVRCHRSFIVNLDKISSVAGNAQGLRLSLQDTDAVIPVSRGMTGTVKRLLNSLE